MLQPIIAEHRSCGMRGALLPLLLVSILVHAQGVPQRITFDLIGVKDGLPHALVECFLEDARGALWVGMQQGLAVYDGSSFIPVDLQHDGAPIGVRAMTKDDQGIIWVASEQGPVRVDPDSRTAQLLAFPDSLRFGINTLWFHAVAVARPGELLFGANQGTYRLDTRTMTFSAVRSTTGEVVKTFWRFMCSDPEREGVWISTHQWGLVFYDALSGRLRSADAGSDHSPLIGRPVINLCADGSHGFWCSNRSTGELEHWDGRSRTLRSWSHVPGDTTQAFSQIWRLDRDRQGRIWGSAVEPGGFCFDPKGGTALVFPSNAHGPGTLPGGGINDLYQGANNVIWLGTDLGIAIHDPSRPQALHIDPPAPQGERSNERIWSLEFTGDSVLWCAMGHDGLARIDLPSGRKKNIALTGQGNERPYVWDLLSRDDGLYIACDEHLLCMDTRTMRIRTIELKDQHGDPLRPGRSWLANDADGGLWMASAFFNVVHIDPLTGNCFVHLPDSTREGVLRYDNVYGAVSMKDGRTWMGGNINGLTCYSASDHRWYDLRNDVLERRLHVGRILGITASSDSVLWLATDGAGLVRYDIPSGSYTHFDQRHGITELGLINAALDRRGRIWTNSDERVFCFDPGTEHAIVVTPRSSTSGDAATWTIGMSPGGLLAMNIGHEVAVFDANTVGAAGAPPAPVISMLMVDGRAVATDANGSISMRYDDAQLEVHFGAMLPPGAIGAYGMRVAGEKWSTFKEGRVNMRGLEPGSHDIDLRLMSKEGTWGPATTLHVRIPHPWWQTLLARILFALALSTGIVLLFRARLNWVRKRERAQEEQARQVNELKLQALRAQMDPHFIFNCLNSVDRFILGEEKKKASHYLNRFARLIRLILQQSESTTVPLDREVEMLKYYLELEAIRFETPFTWEVKVDPALTDGPVELPTMLVQPFVENAIWHGLQHKTGPGHVQVHFQYAADGLECIVEDNGIGRAASAIINKDRSGVHKSMGMRVTTDRVRLLSEQHRRAARITVHDLTDARGHAAGTRAIILVPIEQE